MAIAERARTAVMGTPRHRERFFLPQPGARVGAAIALGRTTHRLAFAGTRVALASRGFQVSRARSNAWIGRSAFALILPAD